MFFLDLILLDWGDVGPEGGRLPDNDVISTRFEDIEPDRAEFVLEMAPNLTWWKGLQILNNTDGQIDFLEVHDATKQIGPSVVDIRDLNVGGHIVLWKAKKFGVHTPMYSLADMERVQGKRVIFRWSAD